MKLVSYLNDGHDQMALLVNGLLFNMEFIHPDLPNNMSMLLNYWEDCIPILKGGEIQVLEGKISASKGIPLAGMQLLSPVPFPASCRDGYAFRQHVEAARRSRHASMIPEFDLYPVFYFTNHHSVQGQGPIVCMPDHLQRLDYELEVAIVICKYGRNIRASDADEYIGGLMIMNDMSARELQRQEMLLNLGPAKGKDFCTALGPWLVTLDELEQFEVSPKDGHAGKNWNLAMQCRVNGKTLSSGNLSDMHWTFAEIIERASYGVDLYPGDIIGSGTVGTGCLLELNGTGKLNDPDYAEQWLQVGDEIEMEVEGLGVLQNSVVADEDDFSIITK
ncbi:MAG: fumarylacetoacetate hydrolase [Bacteroidetes bacterium]|nr:MAG: fumarylacetoacetate hydrolase [Bacteroidota bacterium]